MARWRRRSLNSGKKSRKKSYFLVVRPLRGRGERGEGVKEGPLKKTFKKPFFFLIDNNTYFNILLNHVVGLQSRSSLAGFL